MKKGYGMATIKHSFVEEVADGRRVIRVTFTPQVPNPAAQSDVDVVFEVLRSEEMRYTKGIPYAVLGPLSCTLVDTREPYILSRTQYKAVALAAIVAVGEADGFTEW